MRILAAHYEALIREGIDAKVLDALIGPNDNATYEDLARITRQDLFAAGAGLPLTKLEPYAALLRSVEPDTPVCPKDGHLGLRWSGESTSWHKTAVCPVCGGMTETPLIEYRFDWIAGRPVPPDVHVHVGADVLVPLDLAQYRIDPKIREAAAREDVSVERLLHQILIDRAGGDPRKLLAGIANVPAEWAMLDGLRFLARKAKQQAVQQAAQQQPVQQQPDPAAPTYANDEIVKMAMEADLTDPSRRDLLLADTPRQIRAALPRFSRPSDQLWSDIVMLRRLGYLGVWAENAAVLSLYWTAAAYFRGLAKWLGR